MKFAIVAAAFGALAVWAAPTEIEARQPSPSDSDILNVALFLENLEVAYYEYGLHRWSQQDFDHAGMPKGSRNQFVQIHEHERAHAAYLTGVLGNRANKPCTYKFPVNNTKQFAVMSQVFENVGVSAYTGANPGLSKVYQAPIGSIIGTEARQAGVVASYVNGVEGWGGPWNSPLTLSQAFTLASPFIVKCPPTNPHMPVQVFPPLTFPANSRPGATVTIKFTNKYQPGRALYVAFLGSKTLQQQVVQIHNNRITIPRDLAGQVYAIVTTSSTKAIDSNTVAGPAVLQLDFTLTGQPAP